MAVPARRRPKATGITTFRVRITNVGRGVPRGRQGNRGDGKLAPSGAVAMMASMESPPAAPPAPPRIAEVAGWYGMLAILAAYALNSFGELAATDVSFQLLNLTGAAGVAWVCWLRRTWQAFWLETIWVAIAVISLVRMLLG